MRQPKAPGGGKYKVPTARGAARRVQAERSHRREGRPRNFTSLGKYITFQVDLVIYLSEKNPPAKTPNDPPKTEAQNVHRPISKFW